MIRHVPAGHWLLCPHSPGRRCSPPEQLPIAARAHWKKWQLGGVDKAVTVYHEGALTGFFRFHLIDSVPGRVLQACGTWVSPEWRGLGTAADMWRAALNRYRPTAVRVTVTSRGGKRLVRKLQLDYPHIHFKVKDCAP